MTKKGFLAGLFLLGISVTAFANNNEKVTKKDTTSVSIKNNVSEGIEDGDQSGGGNGNGGGNGGGDTGNNGTVFIPIKPPKPPVILY